MYVLQDKFEKFNFFGKFEDANFINVIFIENEDVSTFCIHLLNIFYTYFSF